MANSEDYILDARRKVVQRLLTQDNDLRNIFNRFIREAAPAISQYRYSSSGVLLRNKELDKKINARIESLNRELVSFIEENQRWAWNTAEESTDSMVRSYTRGMAISETAKAGMMARNIEAMNEFIKRKTDGLGLSDRVWKMGKELREQLEFYTASGVGQGRSAEKIGRDIRQILNEPDRRFRRIRDPETGKLKLSQPMKDYHPGRGVYRSSRMNALRLTRNVTNMAFHEATNKRWKDLNFVIGYEVRLSNQHDILMPQGDICDELKGQYPKNFKFVGWHVQCMCHAIPIMLEEDEFIQMASGEDINPGQVNMPNNFNKWLEKNRERVAGWKNQPYFIRDNFRYGSIENGLKKEIK